MEDTQAYFWKKVDWEWSPLIALERIASRVYGEYLVNDWTFEELMATCGVIHSLEAQLNELALVEEPILYTGDLREHLKEGA